MLLFKWISRFLTKSNQRRRCLSFRHFQSWESWESKESICAKLPTNMLLSTNFLENSTIMNCLKSKMINKKKIFKWKMSKKLVHTNSMYTEIPLVMILILKHMRWHYIQMESGPDPVMHVMAPGRKSKIIFIFISLTQIKISLDKAIEYIKR